MSAREDDMVSEWRQMRIESVDLDDDVCKKPGDLLRLSSAEMFSQVIRGFPTSAFTLSQSLFWFQLW